VTGEAIEDSQVATLVDNWIRLGLVEVTYETHITDLNYYSWANQRPEFLRLSKAPESDQVTIDYQKGIMMRTDLGKRFAKAIGLK
jgi:hypothetical protein